MELALNIAPFIIFVPFLAFAALLTAGRWPKRWWHASHWVAITAIALALIGSVIVTLVVVGAGHGESGAAAGERSYVWARMGSWSLSMGFRLDGLAAVMLLVVTIVATGVQIYSVGYMHGDPRYSRFFAYLSLFSSAMLGLVLANNLLQLYIFWELVGLSSYLLIGFWFEKPEAMRAAKKAFVVTRLGDLGFFLGLVLLYSHAQRLDFQGVFLYLRHMEHTAPAALTAIALLLFCGAIGKSAQFPLHVWLPDAMEGPTPVSALIHAATMVAAGVYLVGRMFPLFDAAKTPWAPSLFGHTLFSATPLQCVAAIGAITALLGATIGVLQNDIKRVLAYSTISQLGYMMVGLGVGGVFVGLFHLVTHAFFKALLFLGSGSVIHGTGTQDMMQMGGLRRQMKWTFATFVIGTAALAGVPWLFSGFWSKEEILLGAYHASPWIFGATVAGAFLTAFYMTRLVGLTFYGEPRDPHIHAHESPWNMLGPLVALAFLSLGWWRWLMGPLHHFIDPTGHELEPVAWVGKLGIGVALAGLGLGWLVYIRRAWDPRRALIAAPVVGARLIPGAGGRLGHVPGLYTVVKNKYYFDEIYWAILVKPLFAVTARAFAFDQKVIDWFVNAVAWATVRLAEIQKLVDIHVVDGLVNGVGEATRQVGGGFRRLQTGLVQNYALFAFVGLAAVAAVCLYLGF